MNTLLISFTAFIFSYLIGKYLIRFMRVSDKKKLTGRILCKLGWHCFTFKTDSGKKILLNGPPPYKARCRRCGCLYKWIQ